MVYYLHNGGYGMSIEEVEVGLQDYQVQILKILVIDAIAIIIGIRFSELVHLLGLPAFNSFIVLTVVLLCLVISTFNKIDNYSMLKAKKERMELGLE